jgi:glyoxylase-like metal-dependent hydrolase (beta-lactamase superfamily II)
LKIGSVAKQTKIKGAFACQSTVSNSPWWLNSPLQTALIPLSGRPGTSFGGHLRYQIHMSDPVPFSSPETAPNGERQMFQYIASTLISGERDAVLVDPPMTTEQTAQLIRWIESSGKTLKHIVITHGHGDHWFGTGPLVKRFPDVTVLAAPGTIEVMRYHASPEVRTGIWEKQFPNQLPEASVVATTTPGNIFELEGGELRIVEVGHTDTDNTTVLHVPSIELVVAGDAVYNGVHQYLAESGNGGIQKWIKALDTVAALQPRRVVASHKNPALDDDPKTIDETRAYLEDSYCLLQTSRSALEFYDAMMTRYPTRLNPTALWFWGAQVLFPAAAAQPR